MQNNTSASNRTRDLRWVICGMLFLATTVNYMDRQVLSLTWKDFIAPDFGWDYSDYGRIGAIFSIVYAIANVFSGRIIDWLGTRKGYLWAIGIWSVGACLHALCGWAAQQGLVLETASKITGVAAGSASLITMTSVWFFIAARVVLATGESGNFPAAIKATAEFFPKKHRAFATSIFNAGSTIGALIAPLTIPSLAAFFRDHGVGHGWEMAFIIIGALGFLWMALWVFIYPKQGEGTKRYAEAEEEEDETTAADEKKASFLECISMKNTWGIVLGKFLTDGVWWFFLFWTPTYISDVCHLMTEQTEAKWMMFTLYAITMLSLLGGKLPTILINRTGKDAYTCRMRAMLVFAVVPLLGLFAMPLGNVSNWLTIALIGLVGAAHQSWSANLFSVGSDLFPRNTVATITGINGMAGGLSSFLINLGSGELLSYIERPDVNFHFLMFEGKEAGYYLIFCYCSVAYLLGWIVLKTLTSTPKNLKA